MLQILTSEFVILAGICALIMAGIHAYLGFHIVSRGVIFVDLSLAQAAALGAVLATLLGFSKGGPQYYALSLLSTFAGAAIVSIAKSKDDRIPQEAFIGVLYVGCAAVTILLLAHMPGGMEELQHMLSGSLLTVTKTEIIKLSVVFIGVGILHFIFRKQFFAITSNRQEAMQKGYSIAGWDFLFYSSFGLVVTSAVPLAGVLLVFSLLVIPPVTALMLTAMSSKRLALGWAAAFLGSLGGIAASVGMNLPAGPSIITALTLVLLLARLASFLIKNEL